MHYNTIHQSPGTSIAAKRKKERKRAKLLSEERGHGIESLFERDLLEDGETL